MTIELKTSDFKRLRRYIKEQFGVEAVTVSAKVGPPSPGAVKVVVEFLADRLIFDDMMDDLS